MTKHTVGYLPQLRLMHNILQLAMESLLEQCDICTLIGLCARGNVVLCVKGYEGLYRANKHVARHTDAHIMTYRLQCVAVEDQYHLISILLLCLKYLTAAQVCYPSKESRLCNFYETREMNPEERLSITELVNQLQEIAAARNVNPKSPITEVGVCRVVFNNNNTNNYTFYL